MIIFDIFLINIIFFKFKQDSSNPDSLANMITVAYHLDRPAESITRLISQLRSKAPDHPLLTGLSNFEHAYDRMTAQLSSK